MNGGIPTNGLTTANGTEPQMIKANKGMILRKVSIFFIGTAGVGFLPTSFLGWTGPHAVGSYTQLFLNSIATPVRFADSTSPVR